MQIRPLEQYSKPDYPSSQMLQDHPELLQYVPRRWRANPTVLAALAGLTFLMCSSRSDAADDKKAANGVVVAPVFLHGEGRGVTGCVAVNPPVFLSEEEARQVMVEEARRAGIKLSNRRIIKNIQIPVTELMLPPREGYEGPVEERGPDMQLGTLELDGTDSKRNISFEFVSEEDYHAWKNPKTPISTVQPYDFIDVAERVRNSLKQSNVKGAYGVFYDPCVGYDDAYKKIEKVEGVPTDYEVINAKAAELSKQELRKQVQDFIKWLKSQGVI